ncbi:MAG: YDG domain-containing protein, partial [Ginsengibacter sp.]
VVTGLITPDAVGTAPTQTFNNRNVGTGKVMTASGLVINDGNGGGNYNISYVTNTTGVIMHKNITGSFTASNKVYDGNAVGTVLTRTPNDIISPDAVTLTGGTAAFSDKNVANGKTVTLTGASLAGADAGNYNLTSVGTTTADITARPITITVTPGQFKYCGQNDPPGYLYTFTPTSASPAQGLAVTDMFSGALSRVSGESIGTYNIQQTGLTIKNGATDVSSNYAITYNGTSFEIKGVSIDASATSTAIQLGTATKTLTAIVTSGSTLINASSVTFTVTNNINNVVNTIVTLVATTGSNGVAIYNLNSGSLPVGLYAVTAVAGSGCAQSTAYFSVYDPNAGFVTGGGWINSPLGAYNVDPTLTGKANFGFNAQYKKGSSVPTGNTEFQFQTGNLNFKSSMYNSGSLVIAGPKAIFQGTGTINGTGNYNFMISAIDGSINGGGGVDKFRIKIWTSGGGVVYDNNMGTLDNGDPSTALGGGSIVIHTPKNSSNRIANTVNTNADTIATANTSISIDRGVSVNKLTIKVMPNPAPLFFTLNIQSPHKEKIKITVVDIAGRVIEQRTDVPANSTLEIGSSYHPGVYFAEVMQGKVRIVLRLIKGRD